MTNKEAAKILGRRDDKRMKQLFGPQFAEAIGLAIAALDNPMLDYKKAGTKGGKSRAKLYKARDFKKWGQMGGRPKKKS